MTIFFYGKDKTVFRELLLECIEDIAFDYSWKEKEIVNKVTHKPGIRFEIKAIDGITFFFLGQEFERRKLKYIFENHTFEIPDDAD